MAKSNRNLAKIAEQFDEKLNKIKLFAVDADGILTTGHIIYDSHSNDFARTFHVSDGYAFKFLQMMGIKTAIISGGSSIGLKKRAGTIKVDHLYIGDEDKRTAYLDIKKKENLEDNEILYMGDDFFDLPLLRRVGFSATAPHASPEIIEVVDYLTMNSAGNGCVREVADLLRLNRKFTPNFPDF